MGRPLKIKKVSEASYNSTTGANPGTDIGFNALASLTNATLPSPIWNGTEYLGVVGGSNTVDTASYPTVKVRVFITGFAEEDGYIIRQKGSHKYLVGGTTARTALVAGSAYRVTVVGDTNWVAYGAGADVAVGDVFTATAALANTGTGRVNAVGQCVLTSDLSPTAGNMSISYFSNDSTETAISKLTNKFLQNFAGGATGGNADTGDVWAATDTVDNVVYAANFFSDEGTTAKSGAEVDTWGTNGSEQLATGALDLAIVENYNS
jgi:predicted RNA binding protein YcfA (HicA-like mRNA interferase family)